VSLDPKVKDLHEAIKGFTGKTGSNAASICTVGTKFIGMLATRWQHICDVALAEENEGKVNVGFVIKFDMTHKMPAGAVRLSFVQRTKDEDEFHVEDPAQPNLPFADAVRQTATPAQPHPDTILRQREAERLARRSRIDRSSSGTGTSDTSATPATETRLSPGMPAPDPIPAPATRRPRRPRTAAARAVAAVQADGQTANS
jgi:hypothetical protein